MEVKYDVSDEELFGFIKRNWVPNLVRGFVMTPERRHPIRLFVTEFGDLVSILQRFADTGDVVVYMGHEKKGRKVFHDFFIVKTNVWVTYGREVSANGGDNK